MIPLLLLVLSVFATLTEAQGQSLALPQVDRCVNRRRDWSWQGHNYHSTLGSGQKFDWLSARNYCRVQCMDLVSIESTAENDMIKGVMRRSNADYIWTSGRKCDFGGCTGDHLQASNNWFWSGSEAVLPPTGSFQADWATLGFRGNVPQPDDAHGAESCMAILHWNVYNDPSRDYHWHDIACDHEKPAICEDSDSLLGFIEGQNPSQAGQLASKGRPLSGAGSGFLGINSIIGNFQRGLENFFSGLFGR